MQRLLGALDGVLALLSGTGPGFPEGYELSGATCAFEEEAGAFEVAYKAGSIALSSQDQELLTGKLASLSRQLVRLDGKAAAVLRKEGPRAGFELTCLAVSSGISLLSAAVHLAVVCRCGARACRELAAAASLLLGSGQLVLDLLLRQPVTRGYSRGAAVDVCMLMITLAAGCGLLDMLTNGSNPQGVLDSAASMFTPVAVLPWLETLADSIAATLAKRKCEDDTELADCLLCFGAVCNAMHTPHLARVAAALQVDSRLLRKLHPLLMQHCLPAAVLAATRGTVGLSSTRNRSPCIINIKRRWQVLHGTITTVLGLGLEAALPTLSSPETTLKTLRTLAACLSALAAAELPCDEPAAGSKQAEEAAEALQAPQTPQGAAQEAAAPTSTQRSGILQPTQQHCLAAAARMCGLAVHLVDDLPLECPEEIEPSEYAKLVVAAVSLLDKCLRAAQLQAPGSPQMGSGQRAAALPAGHAPESHKAAQAAIRALPKLAAVLFTLTSPPASQWVPSELLPVACYLCQNVISTANLMGMGISTAQQAAEMMHALSAALRLTSAADRIPLGAFLILNAECTVFIAQSIRKLECLPDTFFDGSSSAALAAASAGAQSLHTAACRMVHWAAGKVAQPADDCSLGSWMLNSALCSAPLHIMGRLEQATEQDAARERLGMYAAHWEAMQEVMKKLGPAASRSIPAAIACQLAGVGMRLPAGYLEQKQLEDAFTLATSAVSSAAGMRRLKQEITQPACQGMFRLVLDMDASTEDAFAPGSQEEVALATAYAQFATHLLREVISRMPEEAQQVAAALRQLPDGAAASSEHNSRQGQLLAEQLDPAASRLQGCVAQTQPAEEGEATSFQSAVQQHLQLEASVRPAAMELARLLQLYWQQPQQQAAARLEMAQAAATRSCAYLRCTNLAGEGGPSAGQGAGSLKCSACRAVWYCSTACSHADWRQGGHRRVCKALAAERQRK